MKNITIIILVCSIIFLGLFYMYKQKILLDKKTESIRYKYNIEEKANDYLRKNTLEILNEGRRLKENFKLYNEFDSAFLLKD